MSNVFVSYINDMSESDWMYAKRIDKNDKLILLAPPEGSINYLLIPCLMALKKAPEIYPLYGEDINAISFFLGMQCDRDGGNCYIIDQSEYYDKLDGLRFELDKGTVEVKVMDCFEDAFLDKKNTRKRKIPTANMQIETVADDTQSSESKPAEPEKEDNTDLISMDIPLPEDANDMETDLPVDDDTPEYAESTPAFDALLKKYSTPEINLLLYKNQLAECVRVSDEGVLSMFEFQCKIHLGDVYQKIVPLLEEHLEELKNAL